MNKKLRQEAVEQLRRGELALYFYEPTEEPLLKEQETFKVRIDNFKRDDLWYKDHIGEVFLVKKDTEIKGYEVVEEFNKHKTIFAEDCTRIPNPSGTDSPEPKQEEKGVNPFLKDLIDMRDSCKRIKERAEGRLYHYEKLIKKYKKYHQ